METVKVGPVSVSQLNNYLKQRLDKDEALRLVCVEGELSNFTDHASGHMYFSLKDRESAIKAVMFRGHRQGLTFRPASGMKVIVVGDVSFYPKAGTVQLYVQHMFPAGQGSVQADFEALKAKLGAEGLFDAAHKKPIPRYPEKIAIITSPTGAAVRDIKNVLTRRYPLASAELFPVTVQGEAAAAEIVQALRAVNQSEAYDVALLARGGGSVEDLSVFNDEALARAIYASDVPVITGIGHEIDFTIADFAADMRAPTPSAAAELAVPDQKDLLLTLDSISDRFGALMQGRIEAGRAMLALYDGQSRRSLEARIGREAQNCSLIFEKLSSRAMRALQGHRTRFERGAAKLEAQSPLARFGGGFIYAEAEERPLESIRQISPGDKVRLRTWDGAAIAVIEQTEKEQVR